MLCFLLYYKNILCVILGQTRYDIPRRTTSTLLLRGSDLGFETTGS